VHWPTSPSLGGEHALRPHDHHSKKSGPRWHQYDDGDRFSIHRLTNSACGLRYDFPSLSLIHCLRAVYVAIKITARFKRSKPYALTDASWQNKLGRTGNSAKHQNYFDKEFTPVQWIYKEKRTVACLAERRRVYVSAAYALIDLGSKTLADSHKKGRNSLDIRFFKQALCSLPRALYYAYIS